MTPAEIRAVIQASPNLIAQAQSAASDADLIALVNSINSVLPPIVVVGQTITTRGAAAKFPSLDGLPRSLSFEAAMLALETFANTGAQSLDMPTKLLARAVTRQIAGFQANGLDFGEIELRNMLDYLTTVNPPVLTIAQANGFKALAEVPQQTTLDAVKRAVWSDSGVRLV